MLTDEDKQWIDTRMRELQANLLAHMHNSGDQEVEVSAEDLQLIDERCREIDEGRVELIDAAEVERITEEWLSSLATRGKR
jgi:hypothetical protein